MQVETFECEETTAETPAESARAMGLMGILGLRGQRLRQSLASGKRNPFRAMNADEQFVYSIMCPDATVLEEYNDSPIPVRVMEIAALAKSMDFFDCLMVWHASKNTVKDPVLVGVKRGPTSFQPENYYLARWGDVLEEFPKLCQVALQKWKIQKTDENKRMLEHMQTQLKSIPSYSFEFAVSLGSANFNHRMAVERAMGKSPFNTWPVA